MTEPSTDAELADAQRREYGSYVATERINIRGARAFNPGDPVPVGHVENGLVPLTSVAQVTDPVADDAVEGAHVERPEFVELTPGSEV